MKRKIITIDEEKCTGCGLCVPDCPEGALQIIDGKARLVGELLCDGLGACIGNCPEGALRIEEREAEPYDEYKVMENVVKGGENVIKAHFKHLYGHNETEYIKEAVRYLKDNNLPVPEIAYAGGEEKKEVKNSFNCMSGLTRDFRGDVNSDTDGGVSVNLKSRLRQWPIQLALLNPHASYFNGADLLIAADGVPFTYANFHERFLKDKILIMFCPKLDPRRDEYIEKLTAILRDNDIKSITAVRMEVPCCGGMLRILDEAIRKSGKSFAVREYVISLKGDII